MFYLATLQRPARQIPELAHNSGILDVFFTFPQNGKISFAQYFVAYLIQYVAEVLKYNWYRPKPQKVSIGALSI